MGLYTNSSRYGNSYAYSDEITANESYNAALGCAHIMMDVQANDMAFFEGAIKDDVREVISYNEGVSYVNENALTDIIKKIVEMFKKLVAKIKGIIKSFIAKLNGAFKNAKGLVKKYEKQIIKYGNWTGFKVKDIRVPKQDLDIGSIVDYVCNVEPKATEYNFGTGENKTFYGMRSEDINDGKYDKEDIRLHIIKDNYFTHLNITSAENTEDIKEEIYDAVFDEKDTIDDDVVKSGSYFAKQTILFSIKISSGSPSLIRIVLRISFGITTRPKSSIRRTIPVAFMVSFPPFFQIVSLVSAPAAKIYKKIC